MTLRVGMGYDSHRFGANRPLVLAGQIIDHPTGLVGHSDGDAICHALTDAILGAAALGDIGRHFPDTDARWKDADSMQMLKHSVGLLDESGYRVVNVDVTVIAQAPKLAPHADSMRGNVAECLGINAGNVSIKGKTNEGMDAVGKGEGIVVHAIAAIESV